MFFAKTLIFANTFTQIKANKLTHSDFSCMKLNRKRQKTKKTPFYDKAQLLNRYLCC